MRLETLAALYSKPLGLDFAEPLFYLPALQVFLDSEKPMDQLPLIDGDEIVWIAKAV